MPSAGISELPPGSAGYAGGERRSEGAEKKPSLGFLHCKAWPACSRGRARCAACCVHGWWSCSHQALLGDKEKVFFHGLIFFLGFLLFSLKDKDVVWVRLSKQLGNKAWKGCVCGTVSVFVAALGLGGRDRAALNQGQRPGWLAQHPAMHTLTHHRVQQTPCSACPAAPPCNTYHAGSALQ